MIGETALPADNDSVSYEHQRQFMIDAFRYTVDCGGCGFGWWDFQESVNTHFEAQYSGLLNHKRNYFYQRWRLYYQRDAQTRCL